MYESFDMTFEWHLDSLYFTFTSQSRKLACGIFFSSQISNWDFCDGSAQDCSEAKAGEYLDVNIKFKSKDTPIEVTDEERKSQNKPAVCKDKDTPDTDSDPDDSSDNANDGDDDDDDDCPHIYNMGGDSEMLLNRGVSLFCTQRGAQGYSGSSKQVIKMTQFTLQQIQVTCSVLLMKVTTNPNKSNLFLFFFRFSWCV